MEKIPKFENEDQEREYWAGQDSTEHVDWSKAHRVTFPNLKLRSLVRARQKLGRKAVLQGGPLEEIDLTRDRDPGRDVDL